MIDPFADENGHPEIRKIPHRIYRLLDSAVIAGTILCHYKPLTRVLRMYTDNLQ
jgi:hypothetical protein